MEKKIIQISAGRGPEECCRVVYKVLSVLEQEAKVHNIDIAIVEKVSAWQKNCYASVTLSVGGDVCLKFIENWLGTVLWIAESPFRRGHKRKNWFVSVSVFDSAQQTGWNDSDVRFETCRSSGPGGQNVNKVETAVRGTHVPTGLQVLAMDSRSQLENKKHCLQRLKAKVYFENAMQAKQKQQSLWQNHNELERGNAIRTIKGKLD